MKRLSGLEDKVFIWKIGSNCINFEIEKPMKLLCDAYKLLKLKG